jgi:GT2 family glycosyltransferase
VHLQVQIIILNWNGYSDTSELLDSLKQINTPEIKIIVVDNNSFGNDVELLENNYKDFTRVLKSDSNLGFAGGNNFGIQKALESNPDYILLINNDTIVEPNFLSVLLNKFNADEKIGIVAPQINYYNEPKKIWSAGGKVSRIRGSGFAVSNKMENEISQTDRFVDFVSGCCMLIKKEVFQNVGLFDENYFLYLEDTDLCYRVNKAVYKIVVTPKSKIFHKVNKSTQKNYSTLPLYYTTRNRLYFAKKNFSETFIFTFLYILISMLLKSFYWFVTGKSKNIIAVKNAFLDFIGFRMGKKLISFTEKAN